jgi:2-oxoglutarate ferredoxin oxidoreductase subunit alpha
MAADYTVMVGGEAGQGVQTIGLVLAKTFARAGWHVFADQDYESRIRGGHNFFRLRISDSKVRAISDANHILVALNAETVDLHAGDLADGGIIIVDTEKYPEFGDKRYALGVPFERIAQDEAGDTMMQSAVAMGSVLGLTNCPIDLLEDALREQFSSGGHQVTEGNVKAARVGYYRAMETQKGETRIHIPRSQAGGQMLINGNEALALGALAAGCKFVSGYPMTPATPMIEYMASKSTDLGVVAVQAEDEIAAINMAVGAAFAGVRAMTATSGGGFSLMVEALGLAGMTETPIVVVEAQRGGPSTGLPTRTEQSDLEFVIYASQGEFPRFVLAPGTVDEAFTIGARAFNLAERHQVPVILLSDQYLASSYATTDTFNLAQIEIDRGDLAENDDSGSAEYKRYQFTGTGISPRAFPGVSKALVVTTGDEHDEEGHITEDSEARTKMMLKRLIKFDAMRHDSYSPITYGPAEAEVTLVGWGSMLGALKEAVDLLARENVSANMVHFRQLWPFPGQEAIWMLTRAQKTVIVEQNATTQFARLLRAETGMDADDTILRFDGRPISPAYILRHLARQTRR